MAVHMSGSGLTIIAAIVGFGLEILFGCLALEGVKMPPWLTYSGVLFGIFLLGTAFGTGIATYALRPAGPVQVDGAAFSGIMNDRQFFKQRISQKNIYKYPFFLGVRVFAVFENPFVIGNVHVLINGQELNSPEITISWDTMIVIKLPDIADGGLLDVRIDAQQ